MNDILRMLANDPAVNADFAKQFDAVPRSQLESAHGRIDKLERLITEYLDEWEATGDCAEIHSRMRKEVDWTYDSYCQREELRALPNDHSTGNRL